jgi:hypothetical protein
MASEGYISEAQTSLTLRICPSHLPYKFKLCTRPDKLKTQMYNLVGVKAPHRLNAHAAITQVANDATVGMIDSNVSQGTDRVAITSTGKRAFGTSRG